MKAVLFSLLALGCTATLWADIDVAEFKSQIAANASGVFLVTDKVGRISSTLTQNEFDVDLGGYLFRLRIPTDDKIAFTGNAIKLNEKRTSAQHANGSRFDKSVLLESGYPASLLVNVSNGKIVSTKIATDEDRIAQKFASSKSPNSVKAEVDARTLLIEIQQLEQEIKTGVAGQSKVSGNNSFGQGFNATVTHKFSPAELEAKQKLLTLKKAQLAAITGN